MEARPKDAPAGAVLVAAMAIAVLAGAPLVYLVWDAANEILTGNLGGVAVAPALAALAGFAMLLWLLGRSVMRVMGHDDGGGDGD